MNATRYVLTAILAGTAAALIFREVIHPGMVQNMDKLLFVFSTVLGAVLRDWFTPDK